MMDNLHFKQPAVCQIKFAITFLIFLNGMSLAAQKDTTQEKTLKNTLRFNVTNPLIFGSGAIIFGYERQLKNNRSFSVNIGRTSYPKLLSSGINNPDLVLGKNSKDKGLNLSVDYRFYLKNVNKYDAPRGVYIGPYYSYNYFNRVNDWTISIDNTPNSVKTDMTLGIHSVGVELGYQFVLWKRLSVDMILFGPGFASYSLKTKLNTTLDPAQEQEFFDALNTFLTEKIPGYDRVIDAGDFKHTGSASTTSFGYRYMVMIGYRF